MRICTAAATVLLLSGSELQGQNEQRSRLTGGPWFSASLAAGVVGIDPELSYGGAALELTAGLDFASRWRVGARWNRWARFAFSDLPWRANTLSAVLGYHTPIVTFISGIGRAHFTEDDTRAVDATVVQTGFEMTLPRRTPAALRIFAIRDWAVNRSDAEGSLPFGTLHQFHVGLGITFRAAP